MNRVGVVTSLLTAVPAAYAKGELAIIDTLGGIVEEGAAGPYSNPTMLELFVGLSDGSAKQIGTINPHKFTYQVLAYKAAVGKTVRVGYTGSAGNIVVLDPSVAANVGQYGTLTVTYNDLVSNSVPQWGDMFARDVQIKNGDTSATILARLVTAATEIATAINAKYGAGTVTLTSDVASASKYLQFVFAAGKLFTVTIDGIFDGTPVTTTAGSAGPFVSGTTGVEVRAKETEAAILDGYNPTQQTKYQSFNLENYLGGVVGTNYDAIEITTTLPKEYEAPDSPTGWDVSFTIFTPNTTPNTKGAVATAIETLLAEIKANHSLTKAAADVLYAPHA